MASATSPNPAVSAPANVSVIKGVEGSVKTPKQKTGPPLGVRVRGVLLSAYVWYVVLVVFGVVALSVGVMLEYGVGHGLMAFGALSIIGSELVRNGIRAWQN